MFYLYRNNILLDKYMCAKLGDFGFSRELTQINPGKTLVTAAFVAKSAGYSAPELDTAHHSVKSDVYAYGMVSQSIEYKLTSIIFCIIIIMNT